MRKTPAFPFVILGIVLIAWVNLPKLTTDKMRASTVGLLSPAWDGIERIHNGKPTAEKTELYRLQLENQHLRSKLETACEWLAWERAQKEAPSFFDKKQSFMKQLFDMESTAIPASVIYRDPSSWSSSLWIKAGEEENRLLGRSVVAKNSPVVCGPNLLGVIDYVGKHQSRVRLITDSGVVPAVRGARGGVQNREMISLCQALIQRLEHREELKGELQQLIAKLGALKEDHSLAKGELHGSSAPFWRSRSLNLKGVGFNYEYPDSHGKGYDLRSRDAIHLKEGDLLVTSGLDGVFPEGLVVGYVTSVEPLKEGAYAYELTARPSLSHIHEIKTVFILPPLSDL